MGMTLAQPIALARTVLNDTEPEYRYSDEDLLEYGNGFLRSLAPKKPAYLYTDGEIGCVAGQVLQAVPFDDAHALIEIKRVKNGNVVLPFDLATLDAFNPAWRAATAAAATGWAPHLDNPVGFYLDKPAPVGQTLEVTYVRVPGPFTAAEDTGLPDTLIEACADYIVGMAEARDDEHVNSGRSAQFIGQSAARLGIQGDSK